MVSMRSDPPLTMQKISIDQAIEQILQADPRYHRDAYEFVRQALDFTIKRVKKSGAGKERHVCGKELLEGLRDFALEEFGPLALTVLEYWGIHRCEDIGEVVFNMVDINLLKTTEQDSRNDFKNGYDFREAFQRPFDPGFQSIPPGKSGHESAFTQPELGSVKPS